MCLFDSQIKAYGWREEGPYESFLGKYESLLWYGKINLRDKDTRRFLQLYTKDASRRRGLHYRYQNYSTTMRAQETANYLQEFVQRHFEREELRQELALLFLEQEKRYEKREGIDFSGYLYNSYRYALYRMLERRLFRYDFLTTNWVDEEIPDEENTSFEPVLDRLYELESKKEQLGVFWINGRCGDVFKPLTAFERTVIRDHDFLGKTDKEIAHQYGYHLNSIFRMRHRIYQKISKILEEDKEWI